MHTRVVTDTNETEKQTEPKKEYGRRGRDRIQASREFQLEVRKVSVFVWELGREGD